MDYGKYIIVGGINCFEQAVMFDNTLSHDDFLMSFNRDRIVSAGFFVVSADATKNDKQDISVSCFGKSTTLKLGNDDRTEKDEYLIKRILRKAW
jgi:hypothetical protein